jgi:hypothetical protein
MEHAGMEEMETPAFGPLTAGLTSPSSIVAGKMKSFLSHHCDLIEREGWCIKSLGGDRYWIDGRSVQLLLLPEGTARPDCTHYHRLVGSSAADVVETVMVQDGPLWQPLLDYLMQTGINEYYDLRGTENPLAVTGSARNLDFGGIGPEIKTADTDDRISAMQVATAEASLRQHVACTEREQQKFEMFRIGPPRFGQLMPDPFDSQALSCTQGRTGAASFVLGGG